MQRSRRAVLAAAAAGLAGCSGDPGDGAESSGTPPGPSPTVGSVSSEWTHQRGDAAGTRYAADATVTTRAPRTAWNRTAEATWSRVVVAGGTAYVAGRGGVQALSASTGERRWRRPLDDADAVVGPAVGDAVYLAVGLEVRALSLEDGSTRWTASTGRNEIMRLAADGGTVYAVTDGGRDSPGSVVSFADGRRRWRYRPDDVAVARFDSLAVGDDAVFAVGQNVGGTAYHATLSPDGTERWLTPGVTNSRSPTVVGDTFLVGGLHGTVMAQDVVDGAIRWRRKVGPGVEAIATDGERAYVAGKDEDADNCRAVSLADGSEQWSTPVGRTVLGGGDGVVLAGQGRVRGLRAADGTERWARTGARPRALALADDVLFAVGSDGDLRALTV